MNKIIKALEKLDKLKQFTAEDSMSANDLIGDLMEHFGAKEITNDIEGEK